MRTLPPVLAVLLCLASCVNVSPASTALASEPPGARVCVDGRDSGWVTPCMLDLGSDETHVVTLELAGYVPRSVVLTPFDRQGIVAWHQGVNGVKSTIRFPILLPTIDLLFPF